MSLKVDIDKSTHTFTQMILYKNGFFFRHPVMKRGKKFSRLLGSNCPWNDSLREDRGALKKNMIKRCNFPDFFNFDRFFFFENKNLIFFKKKNQLESVRWCQKTYRNKYFVFLTPLQHCISWYWGFAKSDRPKIGEFL